MDVHDNCEICTESFSKKRLKIQCYSCKNVCCSHCINKYFKMNDTHLCRCMYCKVEWNQKFIYQNFSKNMIKYFKKYIESYLFNKEITLIPQSHKYILYDKYIQSLEDYMQKTLISIDSINVNIKNIESELLLHKCGFCKANNIFYKDKYCYKCNHEICNQCRKPLSQNHECDVSRKTKFNEYIENINDKNQFYITITNLKYKVHRWRKSYEMDEDIDSKESYVICPCPSDNCKGCITNENSCNICNTCVCPRCNVIITDDTHKCNKIDVQTHNILKRNTKPCPKCAVPIQKIDGCNQMWCTQCHTGFDWSSGKLIKGSIHNPHFFEWFNNDNNNAPSYNTDDACNGIPDQRCFLTHINMVVRRYDANLFNYFSMSFRMTLHIRDVILTNFNNPLVENLDLRLKFIKRTISETSMKQSLYRRYKKNKINDVINEIYEMFVLVNSDIYHRILYINDIKQMIHLKLELTNMIYYSNSCFKQLQTVFNLKMPKLNIYNDQDQYIFSIKAKNDYHFEDI